MKALSEMAVVMAVTGVAAAGHWLMAGKPGVTTGTEVAGQVALKPGEVFLADVLAMGDDGLLWVDARSDAEWRADGVEGSVNITPKGGAAIDAQLEREMTRLFEARRVVIYCADAGCGLSHQVAEVMRGFGDLVSGEILVLHGGHEALKAAGLVRNSSEGP